MAASRPVLRLFLVLLAGCLLIGVPALFSSEYQDSPVGRLVSIPYLAAYLFHDLGVPGLLVNRGACGWGWCTPTAWGWIFTGLVGLSLLWMVALIVVGLARRLRRRWPLRR